MERIRRRYRQLALAYHPDRHGGDSSRQAKKFTLICEAYEAILRIRQAAENNRAFGPCGYCGLIAELMPKLDGTMVCPACLVRPSKVRLLPPPPIEILRCYFPIVCMATSAILMAIYATTWRTLHIVAAIITALVGLIVMIVLGLLYPIETPDDLRRAQELRSRRRMLRRWLQ